MTKKNPQNIDDLNDPNANLGMGLLSRAKLGRLIVGIFTQALRKERPYSNEY